MNVPRFARARWVRAGLALLATGATLALATSRSSAVASFLSPEDRLQPADAILVFSGDPGYERTQEAARVYRLGYVHYLVFSGRGGPGDSAQTMAQVARRRGVPERAILLEDQATSTYENVLFVRALLAQHQVHRLILVTSPYHQRRACLVARHLLRQVTLINHPAPGNHWRTQGWWRIPAERDVILSEYAKLAGYFLIGHI